jgi:hypothetical protein
VQGARGCTTVNRSLFYFTPILHSIVTYKRHFAVYNATYSCKELSAFTQSLFETFLTLPGRSMKTNTFYTESSVADLYSETNVMHFLFNLLRIKGLYMFRALFAHPQDWSGKEFHSNPDIPDVHLKLNNTNSTWTWCNSIKQRLRWSRGCVLAFSTQVRGFKPGRRAKNSSARLPSEGK